MSQTHTITNTHTHLVTEECYKCGVLFAMPKALKDSALKHTIESAAETIHFWCPNGHRQAYIGKNREEELQEQLQRARDRAATQAHLKEQAQRREQAQRSAATRARNERDRQRKRAKAGVCPCCNRTFRQLARHMKTKHPDFDPEKE